MPKRSHGLFSRLTRLRARVKRIKNDVTRLAGVAVDKDLKMQLRTAKDLLMEAPARRAACTERPKRPPSDGLFG